MCFCVLCNNEGPSGNNSGRLNVVLPLLHHVMGHLLLLLASRLVLGGGRLIPISRPASSFANSFDDAGTKSQIQNCKKGSRRAKSISMSTVRDSAAATKKSHSSDPPFQLNSVFPAAFVCLPSDSQQAAFSSRGCDVTTIRWRRRRPRRRRTPLSLTPISNAYLAVLHGSH